MIQRWSIPPERLRVLVRIPDDAWADLVAQNLLNLERRCYILQHMCGIPPIDAFGGEIAVNLARAYRPELP